MAYYSNVDKLVYNGRTYRRNEKIENFGVGRYDDILLDRGDVGSDGEGTGIEDKIAKQKERRAAQWANYDSMVREEEQFQMDYDKYNGDREVESRVG